MEDHFFDYLMAGKPAPFLEFLAWSKEERTDAVRAGKRFWAYRESLKLMDEIELWSMVDGGVMREQMLVHGAAKQAAERMRALIEDDE